MKTSYTRINRRTIFYRDYKRLDTELFNIKLKDNLGTLEDLNYKSFQACFLGVLNEQSPIKKRYLKGKHSTFYDQSFKKSNNNKIQAKE